MLERWHWIKDVTVNWAHKIHLPFFDGLSLYDVASFFFKGIIEGRVTNRAASVSWSFFLALFPGILFLFTLIPFFPIEGLQAEIFEVFRRVLPPDTYDATRSTIDDILNNKRSGLLSFGFIFALIFATNGTNSLISNFNDSIHELEGRSFWRQQLVSGLLTIVLVITFIVGIILIIFSSNILNDLLSFFRLERISPTLIELLRFALLLILILYSISVLYFYGPTKTREWRFLSPGAILATTLILIGSFGFSYYVSNFSQYNKLYGSIGTLLVIMLWIYLNAIVLIIGFELNASLAKAKKTQKQKQIPFS